MCPLFYFVLLQSGLSPNEIPFSFFLQLFLILFARLHRLRAVPYALWCNRTPGEMQVWINAAR